MTKIKQISPQNSKFLQRLQYIALKPKMLYYYGELPPDGSKVVAIVGARKMTSYGEEQAYRAAYELARAGIVIVSGLALGIDMTAHRGALEAGGRTVGVLGTPIDRVYPAVNRGLAEEIERRNGAIISECPPFNEPLGIAQEELADWHKIIDSRSGSKAVFLRRNRLISGVADAVLIVEADLQSGSLNTAAHAFDQGRLVFAVPGDISRQTSRGCNNLFGKGAMAYTKPEDILDELGVRHQEQPVVQGETPAEQAILAAMRSGLTDGEIMLQWIAEQGWNLNEALFSQTITMLEIKGVVRRLHGNQWALR